MGIFCIILRGFCLLNGPRLIIITLSFPIKKPLVLPYPMNKSPVLCVESRYHQILNLSGLFSVNHNASWFSPTAGLSFSFPGSTKTVIIFSFVFQLLNSYCGLVSHSLCPCEVMPPLLLFYQGFGREQMHVFKMSSLSGNFPVVSQTLFIPHRFMERLIPLKHSGYISEQNRISLYLQNLHLCACICVFVCV